MALVNLTLRGVTESPSNLVQAVACSSSKGLNSVYHVAFGPFTSRIPSGISTWLLRVVLYWLVKVR